jgi:hypothetical protein
MDKEKLKLIVQNLESLVQCLKSEIGSDETKNNNYQYEEVSDYLTDYDEVFYDDDAD